MKWVYIKQISTNTKQDLENAAKCPNKYNQSMRNINLLLL